MKHVVFDIPTDPATSLARLRRQLQRERMARLEAEAIAEKGLRELYDSRQQLALLQRITEGANSETDSGPALAMALEEICTQMGWDFGNAFLVNTDAASLEGCDIWFAVDPTEVARFIEESRKARFLAGQALPGVVLLGGAACWIDDVRTGPNVYRRAAACECGLVSACAFPIMVGTEVVAVLEFFARKAIRRDHGLIALMEQIGTQLGRVVERQRGETLRHDSRHDPLTGLPNRLMLTEQCRAAFEGLTPRLGDMAMLVIDLDGFKAINDRFGHHVGDKLLLDVALRLRGTLESWQAHSGTGPRDCRAVVARTGGDEFVVLLTGITRDATVDLIAGYLHDCLSLPFHLCGESFGITASIGFARSTAEYCDVDHLQRDADLAMYHAKSTGPGRTVAFTPELGLSARKRRLLELELREAVNAQRFVAYYQPIVTLTDPVSVRGFEALARWIDPLRGVIEPPGFITMAEETGLIVSIGDQMLRHACRVLAQLQRGRKTSDTPFISVNIAPQQFLQRNFVEQLESVLSEYAIDPHGLRLEITENVAIMDPARTAEVLAVVRSWGISTSLDDFGTGYSSLSYLQSLPIDTLKIDRSFVCNLEEPKSMNIVCAILDLASRLELSVIAEGIENETHRRLLADLGCTLGQGYLFGRPVPESVAFADWLAPLLDQEAISCEA